MEKIADPSLSIRALRKRCGLTQSSLAAELGVTQKTVSQYETGRLKPGLKQIIKLLSLGQPCVHPAECLPLTMLLDKEIGGGVDLAGLAFIGIDLANTRAEEAKLQAESDGIHVRLREIDELEAEQRRLNQKIAALHRRIDAAGRGES